MSGPDRSLGPAGLVRVRGLGIVLGGREVLHGVDLAVGRGEIVTVIGPNGAGKSTLVRALLGLLRPAAGEILIRPGIRMGYVPQHLHIERTLPLTVGRFLRLSRFARGRDLSRALEEVGAPGILDRPFQDLSGGEAKRVLLARALVGEPELLVLDEPTASIDVAGQADFYALVQDIRRRRRCGIVLVSHDLHFVMAATDFVVCLNRHVCCSGAPEAVTRDPAYLALFGDAVPGLLGVYSHVHDHRHDLAGETVPDRPEPPAAGAGRAGG